MSGYSVEHTTEVYEKIFMFHLPPTPRPKQKENITISVSVQTLILLLTTVNTNYQQADKYILNNKTLSTKQASNL